MLTADDKWQSVIDAVWHLHQDEISHSDPDCPNHQYSMSLGHLSISEALDVLKSSSVGHQILRLAVLFAFPYMSPDVRVHALRNICEVDPASAGSMYLFAAHLTDEEDAILVDSIRDNLPVLYGKILSGTARRVKGG